MYCFLREAKERVFGGAGGTGQEPAGAVGGLARLEARQWRKKAVAHPPGGLVPALLAPSGLSAANAAAAAGTSGLHRLPFRVFPHPGFTFKV